VGIFRERLAVNKQRSHRFHTEMFNLKKLMEVQGKEQYLGKISNGFAALEDLDPEMDISSAWETIRENIKMPYKENLGYYELKKLKPWFDERCLELLDQRTQAKLQWLQDTRERNEDNLKDIKYEASWHFRNKRQYLKSEINELATNSKNMNVKKS
jgi:hypothetical protein